MVAVNWFMIGNDMNWWLAHCFCFCFLFFTFFFNFRFLNEFLELVRDPAGDIDITLFRLISIIIMSSQIKLQVKESCQEQEIDTLKNELYVAKMVSTIRSISKPQCFIMHHDYFIMNNQVNDCWTKLLWICSHSFVFINCLILDNQSVFISLFIYITSFAGSKYCFREIPKNTDRTQPG